MASLLRFLGRLIILYILDWVIIIGTIAFAGSMSFWAKPNARPFSLTNSTLAYPFTKKTQIPTWLLVVLAILIPAIIIFLASIFNGRRNLKRRLYSLNTAWLGLGLAIAAAMLITDGIKNLAGKPRPDMLSRCWPDESLIEANRVGYEGGGLVTWAICTGNPELEGGVKKLDGRDLEDGFRSFPSGHASMSFAGLTYLSIFLAEFLFSLPLPHLSSPPLSAPIVRNPSVAVTGTDTNRSRSRRNHRRRRRRSASPTMRTVTNDSNGSNSGDMLPRFPIMGAILLCSIPTLLAIYIACTRYFDYRHHPADIFGGALLGIFTGVLGWRWYGSWCCVEEVEKRIYMLGGGREVLTGIEQGAKHNGGRHKVVDDNDIGDVEMGRRSRRRRDENELDPTLSGDTFAERYRRPVDDDGPPLPPRRGYS